MKVESIYLNYAYKYIDRKTSGQHTKSFEIYQDSNVIQFAKVLYNHSISFNYLLLIEKRSDKP